MPNTATIAIMASREKASCGQNSAAHDRAPVDGHGEHDADIGEQAQRQPFEHVHIAVIGHEDLQQQRARREHDREGDFAPAQNQLRRGAHRGEVGADVHGVGDEQQATMTCTSRRGSTRAMLAASPSPVTRPIRAQIDWIAVISG